MLIDVLARPLNGVGTRKMRHRLELCPDPICNAEVRLGGIHGGDILCANADKPREVIRVVIPKHVALAEANVSILCNTGEERGIVDLNAAVNWVGFGPAPARVGGGDTIGRWDSVDHLIAAVE